MARIGATEGGGVARLALSDEDRRARDLFIHWKKELELEIIIDEMGNKIDPQRFFPPHRPLKDHPLRQYDHR